MKVVLKARLDLDTIADAVMSLAEGVSDVSGVGADGNTTYDVSNVEIKSLGDGDFEVTYQLDRLEGKFAPKDEVTEELVNNLDTTLELDIEWEWS